ncbi:MAG: ABC transporter substrate-binding protein [Dysgonomonas sp.]
MLLFISVIFFFSCTDKNKKNVALNLGVMSSMDYLPLAVAEREGYFKETGLDIKIQKFYSANERDAAFQSGNVDGVVIDYTGAVLQKSGGIDLRLTSKCDAPFYIVAGSETCIDSLPQLRGKKIAVSQNTVIDYCVDMALRSVGLNAENVDKVEINKIPVRFELLQNNKIDATGLPDPFALMAANSGDKILTDNSKLGLSITGIMFTGKALSDKNESIKKMYEAYNKGVEYIQSHSVGDVKDILIKEMGFTEEIVMKAVLPKYTKAEMPSDKDIQSVIDWLAERKLIEATFDKTMLLDDRFIK